MFTQLTLSVQRCVANLSRCWIVSLGWFVACTALVDGEIIPAPPSGFVESGVPNFTVMGPEAFGLRVAPTSFLQLPDGRFVATALNQIAIGDGSRWDVFEVHPNENSAGIVSLIADEKGILYASTGDAVARVVFDESTHWSRKVVANFPASEASVRHGLAIATRVNGSYYWFGSSGGIARWDGNNTLQTIGSLNSVSRVFAAAGSTYASDTSTGRIYRVEADKLIMLPATAGLSAGFAITGSASYDEKHVLVSTFNRGLMLFDGTTLTEAPRPPILAGGERHITDMCALPAGTLAIAIENYGIVFLNSAGRIVQTLEQTHDHRLAQVRHLVPGPPGELFSGSSSSCTTEQSAGVSRVKRSSRSCSS
jgi:hypothetical protein